jgi:hypothetical protein
VSLPWFRMYSEFATDTKVQSMDETLQRRFIMFLCLHCAGEFEKLTDEELAFALRISAEELTKTKLVFEKKGFLVDGKIANWNKRQFKSDSSTERVREHRQRQRNGNETLQERPQNQIQTQITDTEKTALPVRIATKVTPEGEMAIALRNLGVAVRSTDPVLHEWIKLGFTTQQAVDAVGIARIRKPHPEAIPANYLDKILRQPARPPPEQPRPKTAHERLMEATK